MSKVSRSNGKVKLDNSARWSLGPGLGRSLWRWALGPEPSLVAKEDELDLGDPLVVNVTLLEEAMLEDSFDLYEW